MTLAKLGADDVQSGELASDKDAIRANGADTATLTLKVKDAHGNGITGLEGISLVQSGTSLENVTLSEVTEQKDGIYTATLKGTGVGKVTLAPKVGDKTFDKVTTTVTLKPIMLELTLDKTKAKVGEEIKLTIKTKTEDGEAYPDVPITINSTGATNRQKAKEQVTMVFNQTASFKGNTGSRGEISVMLSDGDGIGLETSFDVQASFGGDVESQSRSVIFTVLTSPDTDKANYWGHMTNLVAGTDGTVYKRPILVREAAALNVPSNADPINGEDWALTTYADAIHVICRAELGTLEQINSISKNKPVQKHGWPMDLWTWTSTAFQDDSHWTGDYAVGTATGTVLDVHKAATPLCKK